MVYQFPGYSLVVLLIHKLLDLSLQLGPDGASDAT